MFWEGLLSLNELKAVKKKHMKGHVDSVSSKLKSAKEIEEQETAARISNLISLSTLVEKWQQKTKASYKILLQKFPNSIKVLKIFSSFIWSREPNTAEACERIAAKLEHEEQKELRNNDDDDDDDDDNDDDDDKESKFATKSHISLH